MFGNYKSLTAVILILFAASTLSAAAPDKNTILKYYKTGIYYKSRNDYAKAYKYFLAAAKADKTNLDAVLGLADCLVYYKKYDRAMNLYLRYTKARPNDLTAREKMSACEQLMTGELEAMMPSEAAGSDADYVYKSPATAFMYSHMDMLPFLNFYPLFGQSYASTREENRNGFKWSLIPSFAADGCYTLGASLLIFANGDAGMQGLGVMGLEAGLALNSASALWDGIAGPLKATENTLKYIRYNRESGFFTPAKTELAYKEPILASALTFMVPGTGFLYAGNTDQAILNFCVGIGLDIAAYAGGYAIGGGFNGDPNAPAVAAGWLYSVNYTFRMFEIYSAAEYTDIVNREYYKQLVCSNSPYKAARNRERKDPLIAFILAGTAGLVVPGMGNFYVENWHAGFSLVGTRILAGTLLAANINQNDNRNFFGVFLKYTGAAIIAMTYFYDVLSAPGYADVYNEVYTAAGAGKSGRVTVIPYLTQAGAGINAAYNF